MHKTTRDLLRALKSAMDKTGSDTPWWSDVEPALETWGKEGTPDYDPPSKRKGDCWTCKHDEDTSETCPCTRPPGYEWSETYCTVDVEDKDSAYPVKDGDHPDCPSYKEAKED